MTGDAALAAVLAAPVESDGFRVLRNVDITSMIHLRFASHTNIRFENCRITAGLTSGGAENFAAVRAWWSGGETPPSGEWPEFRNCEFRDGANACFLGGYVRLLRCDMHGGYDIIQMHRPLEAYGCYMHDLYYSVGPPEDHSDVFQVLNGSATVYSQVHYNNFSGFSGDSSPVAGLTVNRCIQTGAGMAGSASVFWYGNWFNGGNHMIDGTQPLPEYEVNYIFRHNKLGRDYGFSDVFYRRADTLANSDWDNTNVWEDTGLPVV